MRKAFIVFVIAALLAYGWASVAYQNLVATPKYKTVAVDLLGGKSRAGWDRDSVWRLHQLSVLEGKRYGLPGEEALILPSGRRIPPNRPLTSGDFQDIIASMEPSAPARVDLLDPSDVNALAARRYRLRDEIPGTGYAGGELVTKEVIDDLLGRGVGTIAVNGKGEAVTFELGTALMAALIFLGLTAALKPILWDPFINLLERRRRDLAAGAEILRKNAAEQARQEEEQKRLDGELARAAQRQAALARQEAVKRADSILRTARAEEKRIRTDSLSELTAAAGETRRSLAAELPDLAERIADRVLNPNPAGSRER